MLQLWKYAKEADNTCTVLLRLSLATVHHNSEKGGGLLGTAERKYQVIRSLLYFHSDSVSHRWLKLAAMAEIVPAIFKIVYRKGEDHNQFEVMTHAYLKFLVCGSRFQVPVPSMQEIFSRLPGLIGFKVI